MRKSKKDSTSSPYSNTIEREYDSTLCFHQHFELQVAKVPQGIAVRSESETITYKELNNRSNQLAHLLRNQYKVSRNNIVVLVVDRSIESIIGLLAILKAGGAYLPIDPDYPHDRLNFILKDSQSQLLLTQGTLYNQIQTKEKLLDLKNPSFYKGTIDNLKNVNNSSDLAYVIYTSGSTGGPKGVLIEHRQINNYVLGIIETLGLEVCKTLATPSSFATDLGNTIIFPSLKMGKTLCLIPFKMLFSPEKMANYFSQYSIDALKIVPSHLTTLLLSANPKELLPKKRLILGGEASEVSLLRDLKQFSPQCEIYNHYGPTETTVGITTCRLDTLPMDGDSVTVPIGKALPNNEIFICDENKQILGIGTEGELCVVGRQIARGYHNRPELSKKKFIKSNFISTVGNILYCTGDLARWREDGNIDFLGRIDDQVKIRGFRIELGEISSALMQHPNVLQALTVVKDYTPGDKRLVAYLVCDAKNIPETFYLRAFLQERLPDFMIPSSFVVMEKFPVLPNGKIDKQKLPSPDERGSISDFAPPRNKIEANLCEIWNQILNIPKSGVNDNFFVIGGHSLLAVQLIRQISESFEIEVTLAELQQSATISQLAILISKKQKKKEREEEKVLADLLDEIEGLADEEVLFCLQKKT